MLVVINQGYWQEVVFLDKIQESRGSLAASGWKLLDGKIKNVKVIECITFWDLSSLKEKLKLLRT